MNMLVWKPVIVGLVGAGAAMSIQIVAPMAASPHRTLARSHQTATHSPFVVIDTGERYLSGDVAFFDKSIADIGGNAAGQFAFIASQPQKATSSPRLRDIAPAVGSARVEKPLSADADQFAIRYEMPIDLLPSEARTLIRQLAAQTVDEDASARTKQILTALRGLQKTYTVAARLDEAVTVREAIRDFKQRMAGILPDPGTLVGYRGNVGRSYTFSVTGQTNGAQAGIDQLLSPLDGAASILDLRGIVSKPLRYLELLTAAPTESTVQRTRIEIEESKPARTLDYSLDVLTEEGQADPQKKNTVLDNRSFLTLNLTRSSASVWGTDIYTDDSPLAAVAVHAGILREGEKGVVKVTIFAGKDEYEGTSRNGITTSSYGAWQGSYVVEKAPPLEHITHANLSIEAKSLLARLGPPEAAEEDALNQTLNGLRALKSGAERAVKLDDALVLRDAIAATIAARLGAMPDPGNLTEFRGHFDKAMYFQVTGRANGSIWGTDTYTDDTNLGTAALHAGLLKPGQTGVLQVTILPGMSSYPASSRHGIAANPYGAWAGSYRMAPVTTY